MKYQNEKGFTLIELMIVVVIIGILAAIGIANYNSMRDRAQEASLKANMHSLQLMLENYATINRGIYPLAADAPKIQAMFPGGVYPDNPWTNNPSIVIWDSAPGNPGEIGLPATSLSGYTMMGFGGSALLGLVITNG
jgi:prepilin-type N-terminal cleavage/methylation domain-containing protein